MRWRMHEVLRGLLSDKWMSWDLQLWGNRTRLGIVSTTEQQEAPDTCFDPNNRLGSNHRSHSSSRLTLNPRHCNTHWFNSRLGSVHSHMQWEVQVWDCREERCLCQFVCQLVQGILWFLDQTAAEREGRAAGCTKSHIECDCQCHN